MTLQTDYQRAGGRKGERERGGGGGENKEGGQSFSIGTHKHKISDI